MMSSGDGGHAAKNNFKSTAKGSNFVDLVSHTSFLLYPPIAYLGSILISNGLNVLDLVNQTLFVLYLSIEYLNLFWYCKVCWITEQRIECHQCQYDSLEKRTQSKTAPCINKETQDNKDNGISKVLSSLSVQHGDNHGERDIGKVGTLHIVCRIHYNWHWPNFSRISAIMAYLKDHMTNSDKPMFWCQREKSFIQQDQCKQVSFWHPSMLEVRQQPKIKSNKFGFILCQHMVN